MERGYSHGQRVLLRPCERRDVFDVIPRHCVDVIRPLASASDVCCGGLNAAGGSEPFGDARHRLMIHNYLFASKNWMTGRY